MASLSLLPPLCGAALAAAAAQSPPSSPLASPSLHREFAVGSLLLTLGMLAVVAVIAYVAWFTARAPVERARPAGIPQTEMLPFAVPVRRVPVA